MTTETFQTDMASGVRPGGGCGCGGGRRRKHKHTKGGRRRRTSKRGGAGMIDDAIVAGSALTLAHYFGKKRGGRHTAKHLPRRLTKKALV
jgi:hypothetical protein